MPALSLNRAVGRDNSKTYQAKDAAIVAVISFVASSSMGEACGQPTGWLLPGKQFVTPHVLAHPNVTIGRQG